VEIAEAFFHERCVLVSAPRRVAPPVPTLVGCYFFIVPSQLRHAECSAHGAATGRALPSCPPPLPPPRAVASIVVSGSRESEIFFPAIVPDS